MTTLKIPPIIRSILRVLQYLRTIKMRNDETKRLIKLEETILVVKESYEKAVKFNNDNGKKILNLVLYNLTIEYDISVLKFMTLFQIDRWSKQFLIRQFSVLMYESTNDLLELSGKDLRKLINELPEKNELLKDLGVVSKEMVNFKKENIEELKAIRNFCGAHRDNDAYKQITTIERIDANEIIEIASLFMITVVEYGRFYSKVMNCITAKANASKIKNDL